eukprot:2974629-Alexandrium_andersonii.AAC.1
MVVFLVAKVEVVFDKPGLQVRSAHRLQIVPGWACRIRKRRPLSSHKCHAFQAAGSCWKLLETAWRCLETT